MRPRIILLVLAVLLVAGFAAQNWGEITRATPLNFGVVVSEAPLGLILLSLLGLTLLVFLASAASMRTHSLLESRHHAKELQAQRDLAEKAEASRFTDLRQVLDNHLRESRQHDAMASSSLEKTMAQHQRELRTQMDQMHHVLAARLAELEHRLEGRSQHLPGQQEGARHGGVTDVRVHEPQPGVTVASREQV